jgi:hypothetical protein
MYSLNAEMLNIECTHKIEERALSIFIHTLVYYINSKRDDILNKLFTLYNINSHANSHFKNFREWNAFFKWIWPFLVLILCLIPQIFPFRD